MIRSFFTAFLLLISLSSCTSEGASIAPVTTIEVPGDIQKSALPPTSLPTEITEPDLECPEVVESLDLSAEFLTYDSSGSQIQIYRIEDYELTFLGDVAGISSTPYLSPDGDWLYWIDSPLLIESQGQFSSATGSKTLNILNLKTNEKQAIVLSSEWLTALPMGWTRNGEIRLMTNIQQLEDHNLSVIEDYVIINRVTGVVEKEISQKFSFSNKKFTIHPNDGFAQYNPDDTGILYTGFEPYTIYYVDTSGKEIWRSDQYTYVYPGLGGNVWSPNGKKAIYISSTILDPFDENSNSVNIFNANNYEVQEIKIPTLIKSNRPISTSWSWSSNSDFVEVSFWNKSLKFDNASPLIVNSDGSITVGNGFLIDIENFAIKPICVEENYFWGGGFSSLSTTTIYFSTVDLHGQVTIWLLDAEKWKMMKVLSYSLKDELIQIVGTINFTE